MENYIGVKLIDAEPMTRLEYIKYRGWELPSDENGDDEGFLVEYLDGGKSNHPNHSGYISWSPKDVFVNAYQKTDGLSFGLALEALKKGKLVARKGWNGKGMFIFMRPEDELPIDMIVHKVKSLPQAVKDYYANLTIHTQVDGRDTVKFTSYLCMKAADDTIVNGWLASQTDMLANDWEIVQ